MIKARAGWCAFSLAVALLTTGAAIGGGTKGSRGLFAALLFAATFGVAAWAGLPSRRRFQAQAQPPLLQGRRDAA